MGAVESCCGKRAPTDFPMPPHIPINALGNQYVTFQHEEPEVFRMKDNVWGSGSSFDVKDIKDQDWFKLEGRDAQWTQTKKLILNTGAHHCTVEKRGYLWHIYVGKDRRATVVRDLEPRSQRHVFLVIQHQHPYPTQGTPDNVGEEEPRLVVVGDFGNYNYNFQEYRSMDRRRIATVHRSAGEAGLDARDAYFVQVAPLVDVALILLVAMIVDSCQQDDFEEGAGTGRESSAPSSRTGDDRWRHSLDPYPLQLPPDRLHDGKAGGGGGKKGGGGGGGGGNGGTKQVPPLWLKGKTPRS